jgi:hypothetical protein
MFFAGLRHLDRTRGAGWLDCPKCHEHATQDVIDDMTFLQLLFYRFAPLGRHRVLVCRRCGYRRPATAEELKHLQTAGQPVRRAVMAPIGVLGIALVVAVVLGVVWVGQQSANALADQHITLTDQSGQQAVPVSFKGPSSWNYDPSTDEPPHIKASDSGGRMYFIIKRVTDGTTLEQILASHYSDEVGINTTGFPEKAPASQHTTVGGQNAIFVRVDYTQGAENDQQEIYVVAHNGVGYVITYVGLGDAAVKTMTGLATEVNKTIKFTAATETPPPATSPSPSPSASPSPSPSPSH